MRDNLGRLNDRVFVTKATESSAIIKPHSPIGSSFGNNPITGKTGWGFYASVVFMIEVAPCIFQMDAFEGNLAVGTFG